MILDRDVGPQRDLDSGLVVPVEVAVQGRHELVDSRGQLATQVHLLGCSGSSRPNNASRAALSGERRAGVSVASTPS